MKPKKGIADIQFNWALILIAGVAILLLFSGVIARQKGVSELSTNALILRDLDAVLSGTEIIAGTVNVVKIPKTKIEFGCNKYIIGEASKQLNAMNVFAPLVLEGNSIISMTFEWNVPYKATNFVYLTNPETRYIFIGNSDFARKAYEMMPDEIRNDGYTTIQAIQDEHDDRVRIIFFGQEPVFPDSLRGMKGAITALKVDGDEDKGAIEFFELADDKFLSKGTSYYIKEGTLFGAIFADDIEIYDCVMKNAFKKLNAVSHVYQKKIEELKNNQPSYCGYDHSPISNIFNASNIFNESSINQISINAKTLAEQNKNLQKKSCPLIY